MAGSAPPGQLSQPSPVPGWALATTPRRGAPPPTRQAEEQRARQEQQRQADERRLQLQEQQRARRQRSKSMFKRTGSGQPVMKFRLERVLEQLQP